MVPPASDRVTRVRSYSGATRASSVFAYGDFTLCVEAFQPASANLLGPMLWSTTPMINHWFGLFPLRSPLLGKSSFLSFPPVT